MKNKKAERTVEEWVKAFANGTSKWGYSVHVNKLLGIGQNQEIDIVESILLFSQLIRSAIAWKLVPTCVPVLVIYLKESKKMKTSFSVIEKEIHTKTPPELFLLKRDSFLKKRMDYESYQNPFLLNELDINHELDVFSDKITTVYFCSKSDYDDNYDRSIFIFYNEK